VTSRADAVVKVLLNRPIGARERSALGGFLRRDEIAAAIQRELERFPRFPVESDGGWQIVVAPTGTHLVTRRRASPASERFTSVRAAVDRYIDVEIGPSCGGVPLK
jgi:hypothetical protein